MTLQLISVSQFILDATDVATHLNAIATCNDRAAILPIVQRAKEDYAALVGRRDAVPGDTAVLDIVLENLRARLDFFERQL